MDCKNKFDKSLSSGRARGCRTFSTAIPAISDAEKDWHRPEAERPREERPLLKARAEPIRQTTQEELDRTLLQAWELVPNFRIAEDIKRLPATLKQIVEASGAAIMSVYDSNNGAIGGSGIRAPISKEERARRKARETMMKKAKDKRKSDSRKEVLEFLKVLKI